MRMSGVTWSNSVPPSQKPPEVSVPVAAPAALPLKPRPSTSNCRSEEHTSELQSQSNLVCRLLLEKKKKKITRLITRQTTMRDRRPTPMIEPAQTSRLATHRHNHSTSQAPPDQLHRPTR